MKNRPSKQSSFNLLALCLLVAPVGIACKGDKAADEKADATEKKAAKADGKDGKDGEDGKAEAKDPKPVDAAIATAADGISAAPTLARGDVLGHFMVPNPVGFLAEIKTQAAPASAAMFLDEQLLKSLASGQLGERSAVATNVQLDSPFGCAVVDSTVVDVPVACVFGYLGGAKALAGDLGKEGRQENDDGHVAHFVLEGNDIYLDDVDNLVAVSNHKDIFAKAKGYLATNIVERSEKAVSDIEIVGYVSAAMDRYKEELEPILAEMGKTPFTAEGSPMERAFFEYSMESNKQSVERFRQMQQITVGFGLEPAGFVTRWAVFPTAGSEFETELKAVSAGPVDTKFLGGLPSATWMAFGIRFDSKITDHDFIKKLSDIFVSEYAKELGREPEAVKTSLTAFFDEESKLYGDDVGLAVVHQPGTLGAFVLELPLEDASGRDAWKAWSEVFGPENVLGADGSKKVTWSFKTDALSIGEIPVDRWQIKPTPEGLKELRGEAGADFAKLEAKWKGLTVTVDRAEVDGRVIFVISPTDAEKHLQSAIEAAQGKGSLSGDAGYEKVLARAPKVSVLYAINAKGALDWVRELAGPEEAASIPRMVGNDLSDFFVVNSYSQSGSQAGELVLSQAFIDQLKALADG